MSRSVVSTAHVGEKAAVRVDRLAAAPDRSRARIDAQVMEAHARQEEALSDFVQRGIDAADRGEVVSQADMEQWFAARTARPLTAG